MTDRAFPSCCEEALALSIVQSHDLTKMQIRDINDLYLRSLNEIRRDNEDRKKRGACIPQERK